jgi:hypothetical protein
MIFEKKTSQVFSVFLWRMEAIFSISAAWRLNTSHTGEFLTGKRVFFLIFSPYFQNDYAGINIIASHVALKIFRLLFVPLHLSSKMTFLRRK